MAVSTLDGLVKQTIGVVDIDWERVKKNLLKIDRVHFNLLNGELPRAEEIQHVFDAAMLPTTWGSIPISDKFEILHFSAIYICFAGSAHVECFRAIDPKLVAEKALYLGELLTSDHHEDHAPTSGGFKIDWIDLCPDLAAAVRDVDKRSLGNAGRHSLL